MAHSIYGPTLEGLGVYEEEKIEAEDIQGAVRIATERAFSINNAGLLAGTPNLDASITIRDDEGKIVRVLHFRDLIGDSDLSSH